MYILLIVLVTVNLTEYVLTVVLLLPSLNMSTTGLAVITRAWSQILCERPFRVKLRPIVHVVLSITIRFTWTTARTPNMFEPGEFIFNYTVTNKSLTGQQLQLCTVYVCNHFTVKKSGRIFNFSERIL